MTTNDPLSEFGLDDAEVSYPAQLQPGTGDLEAPFVWAIRLDAIGGTILTVRANSATDLHDRINDLLNNHVVDILTRTKNLEYWARNLSPVSGNAASDQDDDPLPPARAVSRRTLRNIDTDLDEGVEAVFDAVKMTVTMHSKKNTPVLNLWDQASANEQYAPCQIYFGPAAMVKLFDDDDFAAADFAQPRQFLMPGDGKSRAVAYEITRKGDKTFVNAKSIGPAR